MVCVLSKASGQLPRNHSLRLRPVLWLPNRRVRRGQAGIEAQARALVARGTQTWLIDRLAVLPDQVALGVRDRLSTPHDQRPGPDRTISEADKAATGIPDLGREQGDLLELSPRAA